MGLLYARRLRPAYPSTREKGLRGDTGDTGASGAPAGGRAAWGAAQAPPYSLAAAPIGGAASPPAATHTVFTFTNSRMPNTPSSRP